MKVLLTGADGQLGWEIRRCSGAASHELVALNRSGLDITCAEAVQQAILGTGIDLVVNTAAYTAVDRAENESELAFRCNALGVENLARCCAQARVPLLHVSTDFVFDGGKTGAWKESDPVGPLGVYGRSKAAGEASLRSILSEHLILRISWVFGAHGHNFVKTILGLARQRESLRVVNDQYGCPTWAGHIAEVIWTLVGRIATPEEVAWGTYHYCDAPAVTWYGLAREVAAAARGRTDLALRDLRAISTAEYPLPARRPQNSVLDCAAIGERFGIQSQSWQAGLECTVEEILAEERAAADGDGLVMPR